MEMFVHIALFLLGVFLIWNGVNSLKKLKENNKQWEEIERTYIVPNDVYREFREENFEEAKYWVGKFKKYISILSIMSIICGILPVLGIFFINKELNTDFMLLGNTSFILLVVSFLTVMYCNNTGTAIFLNGAIGVIIWFDTKYKLLINLFANKEEVMVVKSVRDLFNEYIKEKYDDRLFINYTADMLFGEQTHGRMFFLLTLYVGLFLFFLAFIFDNSFYQKIISF
ncbi:MAG: hypothetical protein IKI11_07140 [Neisseriaceae bacterium]|nr:hypothetical protein [Neisseriaceae bacterium]